MKDFGYGNYLTNLRLSCGFTQKELAKKLNITNKAISKWEKGDAKPSLKQLPLLASIFGISVEELITNQNKQKSKQITKIVVTGGPCGGKSTAMSWIQSEFTKKGYAVLFVPEVATELIMGGVAPWTMENTKIFQKQVLNLQLYKEAIFESAAHSIAGRDKVLIVCDRGAIDSKAYYDNEFEYYQNLKECGLHEISLRDSYDAVFHLVTAAKGAKEFYTLENNNARTETVEQAIEKDNKTITAWTGHPHFRIIDNSTDFKTKMHRLIAEISQFLGEPEPYEIERKFLIKMPDLASLEKDQNVNKVEILQTYLKNQDCEEKRVRQRGLNGVYSYTLTTKKKINDIKRIEKEKRITQEEYINLLMEADPNRKQIKKDRYCLVYKNQYFEIDIYPDWKDKAIMEIELCNENQDIFLPPNIEIIEEVTSNKEYSNFNLAKI